MLLRPPQGEGTARNDAVSTHRVNFLSPCGAAIGITVSAATGCGDGEAELREQVSSLCVAASDMLANESQGTSDDTFRLMLQNAMRACSGAGDSASCGRLDTHLAAVCGASPQVCTSFCSDGSGSLREHACNQAH